MHQYRVQVGATDPDGWWLIDGADMRRAAVLAAVDQRCLGEVVVYVADPLFRTTHENGAPKLVHRFDLIVSPKPADPRITNYPQD